MKWWHLVLGGAVLVVGGLFMRKQLGDKMAKVREGRTEPKEDTPNA